MRSAAAMGPPLQTMFITAEPTCRRSVRAKMRAASCMMSVLRPTSPSQWGMTGWLLRFCTSLERCDSATQAVW